MQSRYYDPNTGRFINADGYITTGQGVLSYNMYAYCGNNPVSRVDLEGTSWWPVACGLIGGIANTVSKVISNVSTGKEWYEDTIGAFAGGVVEGVCVGMGQPELGATLGAATENVVNEVIAYTPIAEASGSEQKEFTAENIKNSFIDVTVNTVSDTVVSLTFGEIADSIVPINDNWIKPTTFKTSFWGNMARRYGAQSSISAFFNFVNDSANNVVDIVDSGSVK